MWLHRIVIAVAAYALFAGGLATLYIVEQQTGRSAVEDAPRALISTGQTTAAPTQPDRVDLTYYLGTFWVQYDANGTPIAGNAYLDGTLARVPKGVLDTARATGEDSVSWQPEQGLRYAIVAKPVGQDVIVAGQSLKPTEARATRTLLYIVLALMAGAAVVAVAVGVDVLLTTAARRRPAA
ncbi:hypothetical protein [Leifsonia shinshuensis]|uniref:Uncharacterized protein n=1 Tax=Leifsonia shinshuensis TaxID=150026 RepID=A0A853CSM5_9MICO|nr:hypothetical protein [Leifsonia shinshuensis]NYJ22224.1 hypothetical protein [Leifsonia shinshuensis]